MIARSVYLQVLASEHVSLDRNRIPRNWPLIWPVWSVLPIWVWVELLSQVGREPYSFERFRRWDLFSLQTLCKFLNNLGSFFKQFSLQKIAASSWGRRAGGNGSSERFLLVEEKTSGNLAPENVDLFSLVFRFCPFSLAFVCEHTVQDRLKTLQITFLSLSLSLTAVSQDRGLQTLSLKSAPIRLLA